MMTSLATMKQAIFQAQMFGALGTLPDSPVLAPDGSGPTERINLRDLGLIQLIAGGAKGYSSSADILGVTTDGRDLNEIWDEFQATLAILQSKRSAIVNMLTYPVANNIEDVPSFSGDDFEEMSEYGVPQSIRPTGDIYQMGYTFKWYDIATRFTWRFLSEANAAQVEAIHQSVIDADSRLIFKEIMRTLFRSTNRSANIKGQNYNVYTFWNGDGVVPPAYKNNTFTGTHSHFQGVASALISPAQLENAYDDLKSHGYSAENGTQLVTFVNEAQANVIRTFRQGQTTNGAVARWDFIPAVNQPAFIVPTQQGIIGGQPAAQWRGFNVVGAYGPALIIEESYIPAGYVVTLGSGGEANLLNPIGFREHSNTGLRGLRLVQEKATTYPLIDSTYVRGFGTGVRQRGAAYVQKLGNATYAPPAEYTS